MMVADTDMLIDYLRGRGPAAERSRSSPRATGAVDRHGRWPDRWNHFGEQGHAADAEQAALCTRSRSRAGNPARLNRPARRSRSADAPHLANVTSLEHERAGSKATGGLLRRLC